MKLLLSVLACLAAAHAFVPDTTVDWSQVKHRDIKLPLPFGLENVVFKERIVGGEESDANSRPYMAGLVITAATGTYFCGGSLISDRDILTAAHCLEGASQVLVILGAHRISALENNQQRYYTTEYTIHHGWDDQALINDIAVVRLQQAAELNDYVQIVAMPMFADVGNTFSGYAAVISGWGVTSDFGDQVLAEVLHEVEVDVITNLTCNLSFLGIIVPSHVCTSGEGGRGACAGDAGGPLVIDNKQIGVVSYALEHGCEVQWPTAYTRLTFFLDWIESHSDAHIA